MEAVKVSLAIICILIACATDKAEERDDDPIVQEIKYEADFILCEEQAVDPVKECRHLLKKKPKKKIKP